MRHVRVVCPPDVATGFALAGLRPVESDPLARGAEQVAGLLADDTVGVVLVDERVYEALPDAVQRRIRRRPLPMVVPFPAPAWTERPLAAEEYIVELLRQVIGYRVRLK
jgi:vacuolar-type H+-ATPase subunit F/Vma7